MLKYRKPIFNKHLYLQVEHYNNSMNKSTYYVRPKDNQLKINNKIYLINPKHVFFNGKFKTVIITTNLAETLNPLETKSKFSVDDFNSAINNKLIADTFDTIKSNDLDLTKLLLFANTFILIIIAYFILKGGV